MLHVNCNWKKKEAHYTVSMVQGWRLSVGSTKKWICLLPLQTAWLTREVYAKSLRWHHCLGATWEQLGYVRFFPLWRAMLCPHEDTHIPGRHPLPTPPLMDALPISMLACVPSPLTKDAFYSKGNAAVDSPSGFMSLIMDPVTQCQLIW